MESKVFFTNKRNPEEAAIELIRQARSSGWRDPDLVLFYTTLKYHGRYQSMLNILAEEYGDVPQIGGSVDGVIFPHDMRTDGAALVLCKDPRAKITVKGVKERGATASAEKLAKQIQCKEGVIILHFPLVHVPSIAGALQFFTRGMLYSRRCRNADLNSQKKIAETFSDYCDKANIFYLPQSVLKIFAERTSRRVPILGINLMHSQTKISSPSIFSNYKDIEEGIAALIIEKSEITTCYNDIFPNKGETIEETINVVRNYFRIVKEYNALFYKNILVSLDGRPPLDIIEEIIGITRDTEEKSVGKLGQEGIQTQMPYMLNFFNQKTKGSFYVGIGAYYPFELFPFFLDISDCSKNVFLCQEPFYGKFSDFISSLKDIGEKYGFNFFCLDVGTVFAFGDKTYFYNEYIMDIVRDNYFGIVTMAPSIFLPKEFQKRDYLPEIDDNTYFTSSGTSACILI